MNALSLFDGISCLQQSLKEAAIKVDKYYASEIDKNSIKVTQRNFPKTIQLGNVVDVDFNSLGRINFLGGGSPCQDISNLNKKKEGLKGKKSSLFYKYLQAKEALKPDWWLLENVVGTDSIKITKELKCRPLRLNSNLVSAQNRNRLYWTNIPVNSMPQKKRFTLSDILETNVDEKYYQSAAWNTWWVANRDFQLSKGYSSLNATKASCLTARMYASWNGNFIQDERGIRRLTIRECERLQTLPDFYTQGIPEPAAYKALGDCWTIKTIVHILNHIKPGIHESIPANIK